jgi:hypothetical protein
MRNDFRAHRHPDNQFVAGRMARRTARSGKDDGARALSMALETCGARTRNIRTSGFSRITLPLAMPFVLTFITLPFPVPRTAPSAGDLAGAIAGNAR